MGDEKPQPTAPSWIDKDFIERALRAGFGDSTITVMSIEITSSTSVGDSYLSDMYQITAKVEGSREHRMIVKCIPQGKIREEFVHTINAFEKESHMFIETLPAMNALLEKAATGEFQPLSAKCLYHGTDPVQFLVLEDLRESGFRMAKRQEGLDLAHCSLAIKTLARFHASSVALYAQKPAAIEYFDESAYREEARQQIQTFIENTVKCLAEEVSKWSGYEKYATKLRNMTDTIFDSLLQVCKRRDDDFNVLIHGDCWVNNMMFKYSGDVLQAMRLVDFQLCHYTSPALELQHFLHLCPREDVRLAHMDNLIQEYYATFVDTIHSLGISKNVISLQELKKKFREKAYCGFYVTMSLLPVALSNPADGFDFDKAVSGDSVQENRDIYSNEIYIKTMKRLLPIFEQNGAL